MYAHFHLCVHHLCVRICASVHLCASAVCVHHQVNMSSFVSLSQLLLFKAIRCANYAYVHVHCTDLMRSSPDTAILERNPGLIACLEVSSSGDLTHCNSYYMHDAHTERTLSGENIHSQVSRLLCEIHANPFLAISPNCTQHTFEYTYTYTHTHTYTHTLFRHPGELLLGVMLLYYFRSLERRVGSSKFANFVCFSTGFSLAAQGRPLIVLCAVTHTHTHTHTHIHTHSYTHTYTLIHTHSHCTLHDSLQSIAICLTISFPHHIFPDPIDLRALCG